MSDDTIAQHLGMKPLEEAVKEEKEIIGDTEDKLPDLPANAFTTNDEVELLPVVKEETPLAVIPDDKNAEENLRDIELARKNIESIISLGDDSVKEMVEIAKQSESPRAFEVVSQLMKTLLDANKDYVEMSTKKRYAKEESGPSTNVTNNNLIVSTADLLKMIKDDSSNAWWI